MVVSVLQRRLKLVAVPGIVRLRLQSSVFRKRVTTSPIVALVVARCRN